MADAGSYAKHPDHSLLMAEEELRQAMELLFFAYRDFTGEADALLADFGFGRAHHRVIYFVGRHPGMAVSELLGILKITKQSLSRVLGQLIDDGFILQRTDAADLRRRHLYLTTKGADLERRLSERQSHRIMRAYQDAGADAVQGFRAVLRAIINEEDRARVATRKAVE
ncbi:MAG TPA: MarR family transcriptional regulator [Rhodospirillales bacterium]|nr:MarR family transcriptional regulator [Rhodospirillales bacterium]